MKEKNKDIKKYLEIINPNIDKIELNNRGLIDFVIEEMLDRVKLYLKREDIPKELNRILAKVINTGLRKCLKEIEINKEDESAVDQVVTSISDNGQSISYSNEVMKYFTTASDEDLFTGFSSLLSRYRRIKVVHSKNDEKTNG